LKASNDFASQSNENIHWSSGKADQREAISVIVFWKRVMRHVLRYSLTGDFERLLKV
jgi:hypothetical protein